MPDNSVDLTRGLRMDSAAAVLKRLAEWLEGTTGVMPDYVPADSMHVELRPNGDVILTALVKVNLSGEQLQDLRDLTGRPLYRDDRGGV